MRVAAWDNGKNLLGDGLHPPLSHRGDICGAPAPDEYRWLGSCPSQRQPYRMKFTERLANSRRLHPRVLEAVLGKSRMWGAWVRATLAQLTQPGSLGDDQHIGEELMLQM